MHKIGFFNISMNILATITIIDMTYKIRLPEKLLKSSL